MENRNYYSKIALVLADNSAMFLIKERGFHLRERLVFDV